MGQDDQPIVEATPDSQGIEHAIAALRSIVDAQAALLMPLELIDGGLVTPHSKYCAETHVNLCRHKLMGLSDHSAARAVGIAPQTLTAWRKTYPRLAHDMEKACALTERFLAANRRQLQRKAPFVEFIVPDALKSAGLPERYRTATFDRDVAIKRPDAHFLAIGHPFVDAMLEHVGSYDFGGLTAVRQITSSESAGQAGYLFVFIVRERITREDGDECLFRFSPVFVNAAGAVDEALVGPAVTEMAADGAEVTTPPPDAAKSFETARKWLESKASVWDWDDDVEFIGASWVEFGSA